MLVEIWIFISSALIASAYQTFNIFDENYFTSKDFEKLSPKCKLEYKSSSILKLATMFDACVKIPNGVSNLNFYHLGDFDECYNLEEQINQNYTIYGKYCLGTLSYSSSSSAERLSPTIRKSKKASPIVNFPVILGNNQSLFGYQLAYCIPSGCSASDLQHLLPFIDFNEKHCQSKISKEDLTPGGIATVAILSMFIGVVLASTIFDCVLYYIAKETPHVLLTAYSALSNGLKLITPTTNPDQLLCLNGIRAISMIWVLAGHMYTLIYYGPMGSLTPAINWIKDTKNMFIMGGSVSVDSFFTTGGIVTVYVFLKSADKGVKFNIFTYYIHRYLRLTPVLAAVIALHATIIDKIGDGPLWYNIKPTLVSSCQDYWWPGLLYIQNFFILNDKPICVPQSWYLSVDFQLFLLSPLILLPLKRKPKLGLILLGILIGAGIIIPFTIGYAYKLPPYLINSQAGMSGSQEMMKLYYTQTHTRFGPYVIGMLAGFYIYQYKTNRIQLNLSPVLYLSIWGLSIAGLISCVYSYHDAMDSYERVRDAFSIALLRPAWAVCLCSVVFMCISGHGGIIDWFLSLPVFQLITKLSYSMYLVHYAVILMFNAYQRYNMPFSNFYVMWCFWGHFMLTFGISIILTLTFESPTIILEKYLLSFKRASPETDLPSALSPAASTGDGYVQL